MSRKYSSYKLKVTLDEDNIKIIKAKDISNYKETMDIYIDIKDKFKDNKIEFVGIANDGSEGVFFTRESQKEIQKQEKLNSKADDIIEEVKDLLTILSNKEEYHRNKIIASSNNKDTLLESIGEISLEDNSNDLISEKLRLIDELGNCINSIRFNQYEYDRISCIKGNSNIEEFINNISLKNIKVDDVESLEYDKDNIRRGNIYYADLGNTNKIGSEQKGNRPVIVIQNDTGNKFSTTIIVAILTKTTRKHIPTHVNINTKFIQEPSDICLEQIFTIDKKRLSNYIGTVNNDIINRINEAIKASLSL